MKFEIYSTSGKMADYISTLASNNFELSGDDEYQVYVEIDSLKQLMKLQELLSFLDIVILSGSESVPAIEIYDDYRE
jgi:hypothetical protein